MGGILHFGFDDGIERVGVEPVEKRSEDIMAQISLDRSVLAAAKHAGEVPYPVGILLEVVEGNLLAHFEGVVVAIAVEGVGVVAVVGGGQSHQHPIPYIFEIPPCDLPDVGDDKPPLHVELSIVCRHLHSLHQPITHLLDPADVHIGKVSQKELQWLLGAHRLADGIDLLLARVFVVPYPGSDLPKPHPRLHGIRSSIEDPDMIFDHLLVVVGVVEDEEVAWVSFF